MNSARTLADRFRTQRTDRIRVDGVEVLSMVDLRVGGDEAAEVVIEQARDDLEQAVNLRSRHADIHAVTDPATEPLDFDDDEGLGYEQVTVLGAPHRRIELAASADADRTLQVWNTWLVGDAHHAWTGNSGIVAEELETPRGVSRRVRLWCSDGLGDPSFDDLVVVITVGPRALLDASSHQVLTIEAGIEEE